MTISGHMLRMAASGSDPVVPPDIGEPFGGGFFAGYYTVGDSMYALIVADRSAEVETIWQTAGISTPGTESDIDGLANSMAMDDADHPAAKHCRDYRGGNYSDWFLPALNQLEIAYFNLKPTAQSNVTTFGANPNAVPPRSSNYTPTVPTQTTASTFNGASGAQAFSLSAYWTSTQAAATTARIQHFGTGGQGNSAKTGTRVTRPFRAIKIS